MLIGVIADDYTGASDIANTLAQGELATVQFLGVPERPAPEACEAGVVALKSRSIPAPEAVAQSLAALAWLQAQGCRQVVFKVCSTFDSTPQGNIGPVAEALADALQARTVPVCPAFPGAGRTVYQGHLFVADRLLSESGLQNHPLNPMTDPDLRRWLALQATGPVGHVPWSAVAGGSAAIRAALDGLPERLAIVDAVRDEDLVALGEASAGLPLLVGGSGIALGLPRAFLDSGEAGSRAGTFRASPGPGAVLAGSCSAATLGQIEAHRASHPALEVEVEAVMEGAVAPEALAAFMRDHRDDTPLVYSSASPDRVRRVQEAYGREAVSGRLDRLFADAARLIVADGVTRLVVAGGETSGAVTGALGLDALAIGPEIAPGVPALSAADGRDLALALKSGNFGGPDFFARALAVLAGEDRS
jgi:uncharacterized protein YgbK (DUF1537 family)